MKFTFSWLHDHHDSTSMLDETSDALTDLCHSVKA